MTLDKLLDPSKALTDVFPYVMEKEMATHSSTLAWRIPWREEPGGLQSMGLAKSQIGLSDFTFTFPSVK